jgi:hypothetical protein
VLVQADATRTLWKPATPSPPRRDGYHQARDLRTKVGERSSFVKGGLPMDLGARMTSTKQRASIVDPVG